MNCISGGLENSKTKSRCSTQNKKGNLMVVKKEVDEFIEISYKPRLNSAIKTFVDNSKESIMLIEQIDHFDRDKLCGELSNPFMETVRRNVTGEPQTLIPAYAFPVFLEDRVYGKEISIPSEKDASTLTEKMIEYISEDVKGRTFEVSIKETLDIKKKDYVALVERTYVPIANMFDAAMYTGLQIVLVEGHLSKRSDTITEINNLKGKLDRTYKKE